MERNEAAEWLKSIKEKYIRGGDDFYDYQRRTAIDYAVSVLEQKPQTNADRIRAMSDEELLHWLLRLQDDAIKRFANFELPNYQGLADWLKQPAESEGNE